jgi:hypothetical protein
MEVVEAQQAQGGQPVHPLDPLRRVAPQSARDLGRGVLEPVHLAGLQRGGGGRGVGQDPPLDAVEVRHLRAGRQARLAGGAGA